MIEPLLDISELSVTYTDGATALRGVALSVAAGERVALIGPNGAGKTSLMLAIMNAVPWRGQIRVDGIDLSRRTENQARSRCGMTFQNADDQLFMPSLLEDVAFGPLNQGLPPHEADALARQAIAAVGLSGLEDRPGHHMSGGQKRSASLATILAMQAKLLLLDEPGSNLDHRSRARLIQLLASRGEAMLLATHDLDMVRRLCNRCVLLDEGSLIADSPTADLLADASLLEQHGVG